MPHPLPCYELCLVDNRICSFSIEKVLLIGHLLAKWIKTKGMVKESYLGKHIEHKNIADRLKMSISNRVTRCRNKM